MPILTDEQKTSLADELLRLWLETAAEESAQALLDQLIERYAVPTLREVITYRLRVVPLQDRHQDADDVLGEAVLQLLGKLRQVKAGGGAESIGNFASYVAVIGHYAGNLYLQRRYPQRWSLNNQLRYVFTHQPGLALWEDAQGRKLCGFAVWREQRKPVVAVARLRQLSEQPATVAAAAGQRGNLLSLNFADLSAAILRLVDGPVDFAVLVDTVAALHGVKAPSAAEATDEDHPLEALPAAPGEQSREHQYLERVWAQIGRLPLPHRMALLLNLRDGDERGLIQLLVELRIATLRQLAAALDMEPVQFAELWRELPLDDQRTAGLLGVNRQQVINLRSSARRQLAFLMRG